MHTLLTTARCQEGRRCTLPAQPTWPTSSSPCPTLYPTRTQPSPYPYTYPYAYPYAYP